MKNASYFFVESCPKVVLKILKPLIYNGLIAIGDEYGSRVFDIFDLHLKTHLLIYNVLCVLNCFKKCVKLRKI